MNLNLFYTFITLTSLGFLYRRFMDKHDYMSMKKDIKYLKQFLDNNYDGDYNIKKPIAWIYLPFTKNSMVWESFYSRSTTNINNTILNEIINKNTNVLKDKFNVLLIDDDSFKYLLDTNIPDLKTIGDPLRTKIIDLCFLKLIHNYGGVRIPNHFAIQNAEHLYDIINKTTQTDILCFKKPFNRTLIYDIQFLGTLFNNNTTIKQLIDYQNSLISGDNVDESNFLATSIPHLVEKNIIEYDIKKSGVINTENEFIRVEDFMSETQPIKLYNNTFMIYIPIEELSKRTKYNWITYASSSYPNQIYKFLQ